MMPVRVMKQAWPALLLMLALAIIMQLTLVWWAALPVWAVAALYAWFHRDPRREISPHPLAVVCPVDGRLKAVSDDMIPFLECKGTRIQIRKNLLNLFHLRSPIEGKVQQIQVLDRNKKYPRVPYAIWIQSDEKDDLVLVAESARIMRRLRIHVHAGERIGQGQVFGYVPFGMRFDVYIPASARVDISTPGKVSGGNTVLAHFVHK